MHEGGHLHAFIKVTISEKFNIFMSTLSENLKERIKDTYRNPKDMKQYLSCFIIEKGYTYDDIQSYIYNIHDKPISRTSYKSRKLLSNALELCEKYKLGESVEKLSEEYGITYSSLMSFLTVLGLRSSKITGEFSIEDDNNISKQDNKYDKREGNSKFSSSEEIKFRKLLLSKFDSNDVVIQKTIRSDDGDYYHSSDFYIKSLNLVIEYDIFPSHSEDSDRFRNLSILSLGYKLFIVTPKIKNLFFKRTEFIDEVFNNIDEYCYPTFNPYSVSDDEIDPYYDIKIYDSLHKKFDGDYDRMTEFISESYKSVLSTKSIYPNKTLNSEILRELSASESVTHNNHPRYNSNVEYDEIVRLSYLGMNIDEIARKLGVKRNCIKERIRYEAPKNYRDHLKWIAYYCKSYDRMNYTTWRHKYIIQELGIKDMGIPNIECVLDKLSKIGDKVTYPDVIRCIGYSRNKSITMLEKMYKISLEELVILYNEGNKEKIIEVTRIDPSIRSDYEI